MCVQKRLSSFRLKSSLVALGVFIFSPLSAVAECTPLNADQIYSAFNDTTISGTSRSTGQKFSEFLKSDGTTYFSLNNGAIVSYGIWHANASKICFSYSNEYGSFKTWSCKSITPKNCNSPTGNGFIFKGGLNEAPLGVSVSQGDVQKLESSVETPLPIGLYSGYSERINYTLRDKNLSSIIYSNLLIDARNRNSFSEQFSELPSDVLLWWSSKTNNNGGWEPVVINRSAGENDGDLFFRREFAEQIPQKIFLAAIKQPVINILPLGGCGPVSEDVGLLRHPREWEDNSRIEVALEGIGLSFPFNRNEEVRGHEYTSTSSELYGLNEINTYLFKMYQQKKINRISIVIDPSDGCGAGEIGVTIKHDGTLRKLYAIPQYYFSVCKAAERDPWNQNSCHFWAEIVSDHPAFAGTYKYIAEWEDGTSTKGNFAITEAEAKLAWNSEVPLWIIK